MSPHNTAFFALWNKLRDECEGNLRKGTLVAGASGLRYANLHLNYDTHGTHLDWYLSCLLSEACVVCAWAPVHAFAPVCVCARKVFACTRVCLCTCYL